MSIFVLVKLSLFSEIYRLKLSIGVFKKGIEVKKQVQVYVGPFGHVLE